MRGSTFGTALAIALLPTLIAIAGVVFVDRGLSTQLRIAAEERLEAEHQAFAALYDQRRIIAVREAIAFRIEAGNPSEGLFLLSDRRGGLLAGTETAWPGDLIVDAPPTELTLGSATYLAEARELRGGFDLGVGVLLARNEATQRAMRRNFFAFGAIMLAAGLAASFLVAREARRRTSRLNTALSQVGGAGGLDIRMPRDTPPGSEQAILAEHIDGMLVRISHLFDAHQRLGNAVAHEMRTPLARIRARLAKLDLKEAERAGLDAEIRSTIRLFDALLSIAQMDVDAGNGAALKPLDLSELCAGLIELYEPVAEEGERHLSAVLEPDCTILGDAQLLSQLVSNLIENGLKYTEPGDTISVSTKRLGPKVLLSVFDDGPGIEDSLRTRLFTPFSRGEIRADKPGHGLGLSLVKAIALRHGAVARAPETEKGFAIEVEALHFSEQ